MYVIFLKLFLLYMDFTFINQCRQEKSALIGVESLLKVLSGRYCMSVYSYPSDSKV